MTLTDFLLLDCETQQTVLDYLELDEYRGAKIVKYTYGKTDGTLYKPSHVEESK